MKQMKWQGKLYAVLVGILRYLVFPGLTLVCAYSFWALPCTDCPATWLLNLASIFLVLGALGLTLTELILFPRIIHQDGGKIAIGELTYSQVYNRSGGLLVVGAILVLLWLLTQIVWAQIQYYAAQ